MNTKSKFLSLFLIAGLAIAPISAQTISENINLHPSISNLNQAKSTATLEKQSLQTSELESFNYLLYTPKNATANMPLIIYLHGGSGKGEDLDLLTGTDGFPQYVQDGVLENIPAYIVMPQLPSTQKGWTDISVSLKELIDYTCNTYNIDTNKISLTGHSMGGTGVWGTALAYPDLFSCIAPLSGSIRINRDNINILSTLPVWAFVGSDDTIVEPTSSINIIEILNQKGSNAQVTVFDGATHFDVPQLTYLDENINLVSWLISHSK